NTIPILANVLIRAGDARLAVKATDLDLEVIETIAADAASPGATTVPAHMIYDIVRKLPEGAQVVLDASGDRGSLAIRAGRAQVDRAAPTGAASMPGVIVPRKTGGEVQRLIEDGESEVQVELSQTKVRFTCGDVVLTSTLIDGTLPDYARVIPLGNDKELVVGKADFE